MNDNREWKVSLEDALREIHRQLMEDEIYLNRRLSQGALPEELPDEEMRIRRIFSLAVMMEETIDNVLKEIESADAEEPAPEGELHSLEYKSHTIGTPDEETASADIEDIAIDDGPAESPEAAAEEPAEEPAASEAEETTEEMTAEGRPEIEETADEEAPAAEIAEAGDAAEADRTAEESGLTDAPEAEEDEDAEVSDEWEDHDDEEEDDDEDDDEIPFMTDAGTSREALRAAAEKDRKEKKKKEKKEKERREKEKKKKKEKDKKNKKKDKKEKKKAKKEKKDKAGKKIKLVIED